MTFFARFGGGEIVELSASTMAEAVQEAEHEISLWSDASSATQWENYCLAESEHAPSSDSESWTGHTATIHPDEPACTSVSHDWQSPHKIVGGIKDNPGVYGHGGGVVITECCMTCGCKRVRDTWAQRPDTGEQGLVSISYAAGEYADRVRYVGDYCVIDGDRDVLAAGDTQEQAIRNLDYLYNPSDFGYDDWDGVVAEWISSEDGLGDLMCIPSSDV